MSDPPWDVATHYCPANTELGLKCGYGSVENLKYPNAFCPALHSDLSPIIFYDIQNTMLADGKGKIKMIMINIYSLMKGKANKWR